MKIEDALHNVRVLYENFFTGKPKETRIMEESMRTIEEALKPKKKNPEVNADVSSEP